MNPLVQAARSRIDQEDTIINVSYSITSKKITGRAQSPAAASWTHSYLKITAWHGDNGVTSTVFYMGMLLWWIKRRGSKHFWMDLASRLPVQGCTDECGRIQAQGNASLGTPSIL